MAEQFILPAIGPGPDYQGMTLWMPQLARESEQRGEAVIKGKTFTDCRFEGPAVMIPVGGCHFQACELGNSAGDMRNLLLTPMGPTRITGAIAFRDCQFTRCVFVTIGFTGSTEFLNDLRGIPTGAPDGASSGASS
jgi:hypothetical protein